MQKQAYNIHYRELKKDNNNGIHFNSSNGSSLGDLYQVARCL